ncbi:MAG: TROVE domain-containing protein [Chloroflexi bacterium]|nr:TROVE domain-containing protein [Chloroflexota bacterium]
MKFTQYFNLRKPPQMQPIPNANQVRNNAGGFVWRVDEWTRLDRFLMLGSEGGSYYVLERTLTIDNAQAVARAIQLDGARVVKRIVEISEAGRAPKNDPALFALAMCAGQGDAPTRKCALEVLPQVARIGTHLFHWIEYVQAMRGWGRGLRSAIAQWYNTRDAHDLAYQAIKYQQRDGWAHRDALRLAHPKPASDQHRAIFYWMTRGWESVGAEPHPDQALRLIWAFERAKTAEQSELLRLIADHNLPREAIPTTALNERAVWDALLVKMPLEAMIRNLGTMSKVGLLTPGSDATRTVVKRLREQERITRARVHPIKILAALITYSQGHGARGSGEWQVVPQIVDALDDAFYLAFGNVTPTGQRIALALDVTASMAWGLIAGVPGLSPRVGSAAMSLITAAVEHAPIFLAFTNELMQLNISPRQRLDDVVKAITNLDFGATDCAQPMRWASQHQVAVDAFIVYTDSETWAGDVHPARALADYRKRMNLPAKLIVVGMVANQFSIADPNDVRMLDVVGFDTATPDVIAQFIAG